MQPKQTLLALALSALSASSCAESASNSKFILIAPVMSTSAAVKDIAVALSGSMLPMAEVGQSYRFNLNNLLSITGDPQAAPNYATWSLVGGQLPAGLRMTRGLISGVPTEHGSAAFTIQVYYKTKTGERTYTIPVEVAVALAAAELDVGYVGMPIKPFDFKQLLTTGEAQVEYEQVSWRIKGAAPAGLLLSSDGVLSGTPDSSFNGVINVEAQYKGTTKQKGYAYKTIQANIAIKSPLLPEGLIGQPYSYALPSDLAEITGDPAYEKGMEFVRIDGLPAGLSMTGGRIEGSPAAINTAPSRITVSYRNAEGAIDSIIRIKSGIKLLNGARKWADGSLAEDCNGYRNPTNGNYRYAGDTGTGVYTIQPTGGSAFNVRCDQDTDGGGWIVVQHRSHNDIGFYRGRAEYIAGFGSLEKDHWLGLDKMHAITKTAKTLRIDMKRYTGQAYYAVYKGMSFGAGPRYVLNLPNGISEGNAGEALRNQAGQGFSTYDYDIDTWYSNCAVAFQGAWWYTDCHASNLNGKWFGGPKSSYADGMEWSPVTGHYEALIYSEMKLR